MAIVGNRPGAGLPGVEIEPPADWFVKESFTLLAPDGQANVIFSSEPLDPTLTTETYARVQGDLLRNEFPGYREQNFWQLPLRAGGVALGRIFDWRPPDGVPVTQIQIYYVVAGRGYTSTGTTPSTNFERMYPQLLGILQSIAVHQPS
jgi:hypothetical protein